MDILDEKFVITAFIAGLGMQSKDLMFSISKNPQASMAEVLAKVEKYINAEEALLSKWENSSAQKEKRRAEKKRERSPKRRGDRIDPHEGTERTEKYLQRDEATSGTVGPTSARATTAISTPTIHPLDSLGVTGPT